MKKYLAAVLAILAVAVPAAAEVRSLQVCQAKVLSASNANLYGLGNGITDCTYTDITAGKFLSYQVYCNETVDDSMSVEVDWLSGSAAGSAYLAVTAALQNTYTTEAAWSTVADIVAPLAPVGTIRFTNNNTDLDIICSAIVNLYVGTSADDPTFTGLSTFSSTLAHATAAESGVEIYTTQTGAAGDKTTLKLSNTGSGSGAEYLINGYGAGSATAQLTAAGSWSNATGYYKSLGSIGVALGPTSSQSGTAAGALATISGSTIKTGGAQSALSITQTINQASGTASNVAINVAITETALGSGAQKLLSLNAGAAGTTEMYAISNTGMITESISAAITASATSIQGGSPLTSALNVITVVATAGDSVTLPAAAPGVRIVITNRDASDSADVFPAADDSINGGSANAAKALAAAASMQCYAVTAVDWECVTFAR